MNPASDDQSPLRGGVALATSSAVVFGVGTTLARIAYDGGANPVTVVVMRTLAFVVLVGAFLLYRRRKFRLRPRALLATLWMAAALTMVSLGYQGSVAFVPVSLAALIFYTFPILVALLAVATGRDRPTTRNAIAVIAAFIGLALTLGPGFGLFDWRGVALALLAAVGMTLTITFGAEATREEDVIVMSFTTNIIMLAALLGFATLAQSFAWPRTGVAVAGMVALSATYVAAYVCWYLALGRVNPVRLAALFNLEPIVTVAMAWVVLGERLSWMQLIGAALVIASIFAITARADKPKGTATGLPA